jgi:two-component system, LuxR family, secretion system response regulator SsrB
MRRIDDARAGPSGRSRTTEQASNPDSIMTVNGKCEKVLVVDNYPIVRDGVEVVLRKRYAGIDVRGASDMEAARECCRAERPDLVLLDLMLWGGDPLPAMGEIRRAQPGVRFVVFTALRSEARAVEALRGGAAGYLTKWSGADDMLRAVACVMDGQVYLDPLLDAAKVRSAVGGRAPRAGDDELTNREKEVLRLIADGMRNREIASQLNISLKTVDCHRQRLMQKLDVHNIANVIHWAYRHGYADAAAFRP